MVGKKNFKKALNAMFNFSIRSVISIICCLASFYFINYILVHHGDKTEILTLIIGLVSGTMMGNIFGYYFSSTHTRPSDVEKEDKKEENNS